MTTPEQSTRSTNGARPDTAAGGEHDFDWIVIGSGFGGSVSALRLSEKGYTVRVLESGRRFEDEDFAKTTWNLRRYYFIPRLGLKGIFRMTLFRDLFVVSGSGVGGGSLGYANTLYRPQPGSAFYRDRQWGDLDDSWEEALAPHYDKAEQMLGVTHYRGEGPADRLLKEIGRDLGVEDSYCRTRVGVFFNDDAPGQAVPDPFFGGEGPERNGCIRCGACMVGCRYNAKNTLMKNYIWFAERNGVEIEPERTVVEVRPLGAEDGSDGYAVTSERSGAWFRKDRRTQTARAVVIAAGPLGTNQLLQRCKARGALPKVSGRLGYQVRTNSEAITAVTTKDDRHDFTKSVAITSSIYPDEHTHIENVTYGRGGDSMSALFTVLTPEGTNLTRPFKWLAEVARHPVRFARTFWPFKWSRRTIILLTMQTLDTRLRLIAKRSILPGLGPRLQTEEDPDNPNARFIPIADRVTRMAAQKLDALPQSGITEAVFNKPTTAHILGGAVIGKDAEHGVIDLEHKVFGYRNLMVCDGSAIPANIGVNPSLTITALTERAMSLVPEKEGAAPGRSAGGAAAGAAPR